MKNDGYEFHIVSQSLDSAGNYELKLRFPNGLLTSKGVVLLGGVQKLVFSTEETIKIQQFLNQNEGSVN